MSPDNLAAIRAQIEGGEPDDALLRIAQCWDLSSPYAASLADLKAMAFAKKGDFAAAAASLEELVAADKANFHSHYRIAEYHRHMGQLEQTFIDYRRAHAKFDWFESLAHGYCFTHDFFSPNIPMWQSWFDEHITAAPLEALEIGGWQGGSTAWMLDKVISCRDGRLTCIDTFEGSSEHATIVAMLGDRLESLFDCNILRTGHSDRLRKLVGRSQDVLPTLWGEKFDFIHIDGAHEAKLVIQDAVLCWGLLKIGGFLVFSSVNFSYISHPEQNTARAVDFFLSVFSEDLVVVDRRHQLLVQRIR